MASPVLASERITLEDVVLADGTVLEESVNGATILVPADATVYYATDVTLSAVTWIRVAGNLVGLAPTDAGANAFDVALEAGGALEVTGAITAARGIAGESVSGVSEARGGDGGRGGAIHASWGVGGLTLAEGARLATGAGGDGGDAAVTLANATAGALVATGGTGGLGGNITLLGDVATLNGVLHLGNGGHGGAARALVDPDSPIMRGNATATAGGGAPAGQLTVPAPHSVLDLYNAGRLAGGHGGDGGMAVSNMSLGGDGTMETQGHVECHGRDGAWPDSDNQPHLGSGTDGCDAEWWSTSYGGPGGCSRSASAPFVGYTCLNGGHGGSADAAGHGGGNGGQGADGQWGWWVDYPMGGNGGHAGRGGHGLAAGGSGGDGLISGGDGGSAFAWGGSAGRGGHGGDAGQYWTTSGEFPSWPPSCESLHPICWIDYGIEATCGHIGTGGNGADAGGVWAYGGAAGRSETTSTGDGRPGSQTAYPGSNGAAGGHGSYYNCNHGTAHSHIA